MAKFSIKLKRRFTTCMVVSPRTFMGIGNKYQFKFKYPSGYMINLPLVSDYHVEDRSMYVVALGKYRGCYETPKG